MLKVFSKKTWGAIKANMLYSLPEGNVSKPSTHSSILFGTDSQNTHQSTPWAPDILERHMVHVLLEENLTSRCRVFAPTTSSQPTFG